MTVNLKELTIVNQLEYEKPSGISRQDLVVLKLSALSCGGLLLIGVLVFAIANLNPTKSEQSKINHPKEELRLNTPATESPIIINKKSEKAIVIEEGSEAWFCLQNNGGDGCLSRDRFAPNYQIVERKNAYESYPIQYKANEVTDCGRYLNGQPNCF